MTREELLEKINEILSFSGDDEKQHSKEDTLHRELIRLYCPQWVVDEINKLDSADFNRWCA